MLAGLFTAGLALVDAGVAGAVGALAQGEAQEATSDGTLPYRILAISMAGLSAILGTLTYWYWKATTPPARRGYLPPAPAVEFPQPYDQDADSVEL